MNTSDYDLTVLSANGPTSVWVSLSMWIKHWTAYYFTGTVLLKKEIELSEKS